MISGLDHVQLAGPPGCEAAARDFYSGLLRMPEIEKPEALRARGGTWFTAGPHQVHIGIEDPFTPAKKAHPALIANDLDALHQRLTSAGYACNWDEAIPGVRRFYCHDPFGNRLEFVAPASSPRE
jgi:catechol 2,3-dioxygenase-like lactoylglutathione lyase family enzyme